MEQIKLIEWDIDEILGQLRRISLVTQPAHEEEFMFFSKDIEFRKVDSDKRIITGVVVTPEKRILRYDDNGEKYYGFFSKETIRKAAEIFFKSGSNLNKTTLEHETEVDGVNVFESWIVEDPDMDKSRALGFENVKQGTWFVSMKVDNDAVWDNFIKTGIIRGFSIEAKLQEKTIIEEMNTIINSKLDDDEKYNSLLKIVDEKVDKKG